MSHIAHVFSFLCCPIMYLYVLRSVLWCPLRFPHKTMFGSSLPPVVCRKAIRLIYVICVCLRRVVSTTYCVVFLFCFCSSCVPYVSRFSGLSNFHHTYSKGCPLGVLDLIEYGTVVNMDLVYKEYHSPKMWWISIEDQLIMVVSSPLHDI
jgi:hypothetical protein